MSLALEQCPAPPPAPDRAANSDRPDFRAFPELSPREIMILFLACDVCLGGAGEPFHEHSATAIHEAGMTVEDVRELLRHIAPYAGFNAVGMAFEQLLEIADSLSPDEAPAAEPPERGAEAPPYSAWAIDGFEALDPVFAAELRHCTDHLWSRPGLCARERALATLAVDIAGGTLGCSFAAHVALAHQHGIDAGQVAAMLRLVGQRLPARAEQAVEALTVAAAA